MRIETLPFDEMPSGVPAPAVAELAPLPGPKPERFTPMQAGTERTRELARRGAAARWEKARKLKVLDCLGLRPVGADLSALEPFLEMAEEWAAHQITSLAQIVGGGVCSAGPASMIGTAALQLASSRYLFSLGQIEHLKLASSLADSSRQNIAMAFELVAREAKARPRDPLAELERRMGLNQ